MISPYHQSVQNGIILHLKVTPNASKNEVCGVINGPDSQQFLKVKINELADDGKANKALIKFLAKEWGIAVSDIELISGKTARIKKLLIKNKQCVLPVFPLDKA